MTIYYSTDISKINVAETEVVVEVTAKSASGETNRYNAGFCGTKATTQVIDFLNSVKSLVDKDQILDITVDTRLEFLE